MKHFEKIAFAVVTLAIFGLLGRCFTGVLTYQDGARTAMTVSRLHGLCKKIAELERDCPELKSRLQLDQLLHHPDPCWNGPYERPNNLKDGWRRPIKLFQQEAELSLTSAAADKKQGTADDLQVTCTLSAEFGAPGSVD